MPGCCLFSSFCRRAIHVNEDSVNAHASFRSSLYFRQQSAFASRRCQLFSFLLQIYHFYLLILFCLPHNGTFNIIAMHFSSIYSFIVASLGRFPCTNRTWLQHSDWHYQLTQKSERTRRKHNKATVNAQTQKVNNVLPFLLSCCATAPLAVTPTKHVRSHYAQQMCWKVQATQEISTAYAHAHKQTAVRSKAKKQTVIAIRNK